MTLRTSCSNKNPGGQVQAFRNVVQKPNSCDDNQGFFFVQFVGNDKKIEPYVCN